MRNLDDVYDFIAEDNPTAAAATVARIREAADRLGTFPAMGRASQVPSTRELVVPGTPYFIPYRVRGGEVEIIRVIHTSRRWPERR